MTEQNEFNIGDISDDVVEVLPPPAIKTEEDTPFPVEGQISPATGVNQGNLSDSDSLDDAITTFKYLTGRKVLWISMIAMGVSAISSVFLSVFNIKGTLMENTFEVFKLIAMTVLGYIFGTKSK